MDEIIKIEDYSKGILIAEREDTLSVEFAYPRQNQIKYIFVGLSDVRASDGIRISYDFDRDGYVIEQPFTKEVQRDGYIKVVEHWKEVGYFESWSQEHLNETLP